MSDETTTLTLDMTRVLPCAQSALGAINELTNAERTLAIALIVFAVGGPKNSASVLATVADMLPQLEEQAKAAPKLWCVHVQGPDTMLGMPDRETAELRAKEWNAMFEQMMAKDPHPYDPVMRAEVVEWPYDAASHAEEMTEHGGNPTEIC